jgi:hypothetical protein
MPTSITARPIAVTAILAAVILMLAVEPGEASSPATGVDRAEAEALVALVPEVKDLIAEGHDVQFAPSETSHFNAEAYFGFYVWIPNPVSSGIIGRYAVNKRTADLWDWMLSAWVCSPAIDERQAEIRQEHSITAEVIDQYRGIPTDIGEDGPGYMVCREDRPAAKWALEVARQRLGIDSVSDMTFARPWGCRDEQFWKIVRLGKAAVPDLLTLVDDDSPTGLQVDLFGGEYQVGDIAVLALTKIYPDLPLLEFVDNPQQPRFETVGFGVYWAYVRESRANRRDLQHTLSEWVVKNEDRLKWVAVPGHPAGGWYALGSPDED